MAITKGVKRALAYCHVAGALPKGIHITTWSKAFDLVDRIGDRYTLKPEALAAIEDEPFFIAHRLLTARGFTPILYERRTSHYLRYRGPELAQALSFRSGGLHIQPHRVEPPYTEGREHLTAEEVKAAVASL